ncbi:hypothetical protein WJX74_008119 [Apatococcus lobatus]|uniref:legumain n=1 Tax=Apatococcus lobatus TaxID=904363 RepID=A0AAW1QD80_9CHLO
MSLAGLCLALGLIATTGSFAFRVPDVLRSFTAGHKPKGVDWALLVAGSSGWGNYRHQADVCHAYQVLKNGGLDDDHIIVMMADDLANNPWNPHPGKLFNRPYGPDVYEGVPLDYTGAHVNTETFLKVLAGHENASDLIGGSGKTVRSGPEDRVFVYYADHGAPGIVGMPSGPFLYADQLHTTLREKAARKGFKDLVIYLEACEAGSMFEGVLSNDLNVYATTAANAEEGSWGTYCPGMTPSVPPEFTTCLGDLYSVAWLENSDNYDLRKETLEQQFERVRNRTSNNNTFVQGSHAMQYGSLLIDEEPAADYLGMLNTGDRTMSGADKAAFQAIEKGGQQAIPQRQADLVPLWTAITGASDAAAVQKATAALTSKLDERAVLDAGISAAILDVLKQPEAAAAVKGTYDAQWQKVMEPLLARGIIVRWRNRRPDLSWLVVALNKSPSMQLVEAFVGMRLPRDKGRSLVDDWDCLREMVEAWESVRGPLDQYGMQHTRAFANLCNSGVTSQAFKASVNRTTPAAQGAKRAAVAATAAWAKAKGASNAAFKEAEHKAGFDTRAIIGLENVALIPGAVVNGPNYPEGLPVVSLSWRSLFTAIANSINSLIARMRSCGVLRPIAAAHPDC